MATATPLAAEDQRQAAAPSSRPTFTCPQCGHVLSTSGLGRHRIFFEPADTGLSDPVMNGRCPECGRALPGKNQS